MKYTVQNIIFPDPTVCCETKMYYIAHGSFIQNKQELHLNYATQCAFSTYFNSFSANKWRKYTKIDNLQLELIYQGKLKIEIFSAYWYLGKAIIECQNSHIVESSSKDVLHMPIDFDKYDNIFFVDKTRKYSSLAQSVEHSAVNRRVVGSSPTGGAMM